MTDLREARLVDLLPKAVADRQEVKALSDAWHDLAVMTLDFSDRAKTYTGIDQAPEVLLDILAVQFRVDWYRDDYPVETKRELIKTAMEVHRHCGTRWAVEKALSLIYPKTSIKEWFEYGGQPGGQRDSLRRRCALQHGGVLHSALAGHYSAPGCQCGSVCGWRGGRELGAGNGGAARHNSTQNYECAGICRR